MKTLGRGIIAIVAFLIISMSTTSASGSSYDPGRDYCKLNKKTSNGILVSFGSSGELFAAKGNTAGRSYPQYKDINVPTIPAGKYRVYLHAYDFADGNGGRNHKQTEEEIRVRFWYGSSLSSPTHKSSDGIADYRNFAEWFDTSGQTYTITSPTSRVRVEHANQSSGGNLNSVWPGCMLLEPIVTTKPTPEIDNGSCIASEGNFVRYNRTYALSSNVRNNANAAVYLREHSRTIKNANFLDSGGSFYMIGGKDSKLSAGQTKKYVQTSGNWRIADKPSSRTSAKVGSYDFMIEHKVRYDVDKSSSTSNDKYAKQCVYYSVTWCGDGTRDLGYETCDPKDPRKTGWGNSGCSNTCQPINVDPKATCDTLNIDDSNIFAPGSVNFTCSGQNVDSTKVACGDGRSVNAATGKCTYTSPGTYTMTCVMTGGGVSVSSPTCKKTVTVNTVAPSIKVVKTALNNSDIQTIDEGGTAQFKIKVENIGNEDLTKNIILSDPLSSACGGTVVLPYSKPSGFKNFQYFGDGNHANQILEPGEGFEYTCSKTNVASNFVNVVSVNGVGVNSRTRVSDSDPSTVQTKIDPVTIPRCPYVVSGNGLVVDLRSAGRLRSEEGKNNRKTVNLSKLYEAGNYKVTLYAADGYQSRSNSGIQPNEIIKINFLNNSTTVGTSNSTTDLQDGVPLAIFNGVVNNSLNVQSFNKIEVVHAAYVDNSNANSIEPVCALIQKVLNPSIEIDKVDNNERDLDVTVGNDSQTILVGHTSSFKITVKNNGSESLRSIVLSDAQAPNCAGSVSLPGVYPSNWSNFKMIGGNSDAYLDPGESFSFTCDRPQTTTGYVNTASVSAKGITTGQVVIDDDTSPVIVDTNSDSDVCPYKASGDQILINFKDWTIGDWDSTPLDAARIKKYKPSTLNNITIPKGRYRISLAAFDGYKDRSKAQPNEQYHVTFRTSNWEEISRTNDTEDIRDDSNNASWYGVVNNNFYLSQDVSYLSTDHINTQKSGQANSLKAKCMLLEPIGVSGDPEIAIDKTDANSNDQDGGADDTQTVSLNEKAVFKITVTNTGTEDLKNIVISDAIAPNCAGPVTLPTSAPGSFIGFKIITGNNDAVFNPGEVFEYTCERANTTEEYTNIAGVTAVGRDSNISVNDANSSIVLLSKATEPSILIDKTDENQQGDLDGEVNNDSQTVGKGKEAIFKIKVTNNGSENLTNIVINDVLAPNCAGDVTLPGARPTSFIGFTIGGPGNNGDNVLEPNEYFTYTCKKSNTQDSYTNTIEITAKGDTSGEGVDAKDTSEVLITNPPIPEITIDKVDNNSIDDTDGVNGNDSQSLLQGKTARFKIRVTNTGFDNLMNVKVTDALAPSCNADISLPASSFVSKNLTAGGQGNYNDSVLEHGEWVEYSCAKGNTQETYVNVANVTAIGVLSGLPVDAKDDTNIIVEDSNPSVRIIKIDANPNDTDGGVSDSQTVSQGSDAIFKIIVLNDGNEDLQTIEIFDELAPNCAGLISLSPLDYPGTWSRFNQYEGTLTDSVLEPGERFSYVCTAADTIADYENIASVKAEGVNSGNEVSDTDESKVIVKGPSIKIDKTDANPEDLDEGAADTQTVTTGEAAVFKITVTNTGTEDLKNIVLTDAKAPSCGGTVTLPSTFPSTWSNIQSGNGGGGVIVGGAGTNPGSTGSSSTDTVLSPGESFSYTCVQDNTVANYENIASVTAQGVDSGVNTNDSDGTDVIVDGDAPSIKIDKTDANPEDLDEGAADTQTVTTGEAAVFKITVTNTGTEGLKNIVITDVMGPSCGGTVELPTIRPSSFENFIEINGNGDSIFDPGESFSYNCSKENTAENYTNTVVVKANGTDSNTPVESQDITEIKIQGSLACNSLDVDSAVGNATHTTNVVCSGTDVNTYEISCGNGSTPFTGNGTGTGAETFTKSCVYSSAGTYTPTCKINGETTVTNSCKKTVIVNNPGGSSSGGTSPQCKQIKIEENSSETDTLSTQIECIGNSKVDSIRLEYGNGEYEIANNVSGGSHIFEVDYKNTTGSRDQYQAKCYISGSSTLSDRNSSAWKSTLACQDNVSVGTDDGSSSSSSGGSSTSSSSGGTSTSSSSGGGKSYCGDGTVQRPNSKGQNEECDRSIKLAPNGITSILGEFPAFCTSECKITTVTIPGEGSIKAFPGNNTIIGNNQDAMYGIKPYIANNSGDRIYFDERLCVYKIGNKEILTGNDVICSNNQVGLLIPGEKKYVDAAEGYFKGNISAIPAGKTFSDTILSTTLEGVPNAWFSAQRNVRVSKPSVATVGGGISLMKNDTSTDNLADVSELATTQTAGGQTFVDQENTNFQGTSISQNNALSSSADTVNTATDAGGQAIDDQIAADDSSYNDSVDSLTSTSTSPATTTLTSLPTQAYNGLENIYIVDNANLKLPGGTISNSKATTYIINGGDLIIEENILSDAPIAFIVKGGDIKVGRNVEEMNGTYVTIPKSGNGGKILATGGSTSTQLVIKGGVYGDKSNLVQNRTHISNQGGASDQISVGTIVWRGASLFSETPPLLRSFINEYTEETKIAQ